MKKHSQNYLAQSTAQLLRAAIFSVFALFVAPSLVSADTQLELAEARLALKASQQRANDLEEQLSLLSGKNTLIAESLAAANTEATRFKKSYIQIRSEMDALGIDLLEEVDANSQSSRLRARLADSLEALELERGSNQDLADALLELSEAAQVYAALTQSGESSKEEASKLARLLAEALADSKEQLREIIGEHAYSATFSKNEAADVHSAKVIAYDQKADLVVLNVGSKSGARIGMPFRLARKDRLVGEIFIVDIRDHVAGGFVTSLVQKDEQPRVGDLAVVDATSAQLSSSIFSTAQNSTQFPNQ